MTPIILFSFLAAIVYLGWMIVTAWKRRWRKLGIQLAGGVVCASALYVVEGLHSHYRMERYFEGLFDTSVAMPPPLFIYDSPRAFNGDGYSIEVYVLPESIRERFARFDEKEMAEYPKRPDQYCCDLT